jgi:hypothetical protein
MVVLCHLVLQVLVPAALCCHQDSSARSAKKECCPAGSHPGHVCPLHGAKGAKKSATDCSAGSQRDFRDLIIVLNNGGVIPAPLLLGAPTGSESAIVTVAPQAILVANIPPGPPPRA